MIGRKKVSTMDIHEIIAYLVAGYFFIITPTVLFVLSLSTTFEEGEKGGSVHISTDRREEYRKAA